MDAIELTKELIIENSENNKAGELGIAKLISEKLDNLSIKYALLPFGGQRANLIAEIGTGKDGLMLNGHLDTVPIGDETKWHHSQGEETRGRIYGRGASDMKGGIASMLSALEKANTLRLNKRILLVLVSDEESFSSGSLKLLKKHHNLLKGVRYGIISEPTGLGVQIAQKGAVGIKIEVSGKPAHGSTPWKGRNAIVDASKFITQLQKDSGSLKKHKLFGRSSQNIGTITGGTMGNVVPEACTIEIDRRIIPGETGKTALSKIRDTISKQRIKAKASITFDAPPFNLDPSSRIASLVKTHSKTQFLYSNGYTEAELYKKLAGIDSVVFGPGEKRMAHTYDESISIKKLRAHSECLVSIIRDYAT